VVAATDDGERRALLGLRVSSWAQASGLQGFRAAVVLVLVRVLARRVSCRAH
jgi:hypothetical protein